MIMLEVVTPIAAQKVLVLARAKLIGYGQKTLSILP